MVGDVRARVDELELGGFRRSSCCIKYKQRSGMLVGDGHKQLNLEGRRMMEEAAMINLKFKLERLASASGDSTRPPPAGQQQWRGDLKQPGRASERGLVWGSTAMGRGSEENFTLHYIIIKLLRLRFKECIMILIKN
jgi:hypothetical protein